jgi:DNA-binding GntR family transcriptional regulator
VHNCQTMSVMSTTYEHLRSLVTSGELTPGTRLAELPLASKLGVSRPTVREALRRLESNGLADSDGRSLRVAQMAASELRSTLLMRSALDGLHAELAAARVRKGEVAPADLRRLSRLADETERATDAGDHRSAIELNRAFHQAIDDLADSPVSRAASDRLWERILVATERSLAAPRRGDIVNREHRDLLAAIVAGDAGRALELATWHVRATLAATQPAEPE